MSNPSRIGIATSGYRTGQSNPGRICIATHGYRCPEGAVVVVDDGDGGTGIRNVWYEREPTEPPKNLKKLASLAVLAIREFYE